tara:strand:- start:41 stop:730 length:690 start_codon:yes stop_codon:yes gene_type:complete
MKLSIDKKIFKKHPLFKVGFVLLQQFDNRNKIKESKHLLQDAQKLIRLTFNKNSKKTSTMLAPYRVAQEEFGKKAKHFETSVEKLLKRVTANRSVVANNVLTNLLNHLSLKYIIPVGVDDLGEIGEEVNFKLASGREKAGILRKLHKGEIYYRDEQRILGTKLDHWKSSKTKLKPNSISAVIHFEALGPLDKKKLKAIMNEAEGLITGFCGGQVKRVILDKSKSSIDLI